MIIFDRSWYNLASVERVMGFCTLDEVARFLEIAPAFEKATIDSGIVLIKYWLEVGPEEQTRRLRRGRRQSAEGSVWIDSVGRANRGISGRC